MVLLKKQGDEVMDRKQYDSALLRLRESWQRLDEDGREAIRDQLRIGIQRRAEAHYPILLEKPRLGMDFVSGRSAEDSMCILFHHLAAYSDDELAMDLFNMRTRTPNAVEEVCAQLRTASEMMKIHGFVPEYRRVLRIIQFYGKFVANSMTSVPSN